MGARDLLTFDEATHTYRLLGAVVPSVTQVLTPLIDLSGIPPAVLEAKRQLGQDVHFACQLLDEDDLDEDSVTEDIEPYLRAYRKFKADTGARVLLNERQVAEPMLMYAGTLDRVMEIGGTRWLIDLKTCIASPIAVGPQTSAYLRALGDTRVTHRGALRLRPNGTYRLDHLTGADDWSVFVSCLTLWRFKETNGAHG
jgi:hypothetical protein